RASGGLSISWTSAPRCGEDGTLMIKRVCLITPPSIFLLDERVFMTLGILKVAAVLEQAGIQVEMLDLSGVENYEEVVRDHVRNGHVNCYVLTADAAQLP